MTLTGAATTKGLKLKLGQYHLRIWFWGFEYGNRLGGRVMSVGLYMRKWLKK